MDRSHRALIALLGGFGAVALSTVATPASQPSPRAAVHIKNHVFHPRIVVIRAGETVGFANDDSSTHSVAASDHSFASGPLTHGQATYVTFSRPGTYTVSCPDDPQARGTIIVK